MADVDWNLIETSCSYEFLLVGLKLSQLPMFNSQEERRWLHGSMDLDPHMILSMEGIVLQRWWRRRRWWLYDYKSQTGTWKFKANIHQILHVMMALEKKFGFVDQCTCPDRSVDWSCWDGVIWFLLKNYLARATSDKDRSGPVIDVHGG